MPSRSTYVRPAPLHPVDPAYTDLVASFERSLRAARKSPRTLETYLESLRLFGQFLADHELPQPGVIRVEAIERRHIEQFMIDLLEHYKPTTAHNRYRALLRFFGWLVEEDELARSPMAHMDPPKLPEPLTPTLSDEVIAALLKTCDGHDFRDRRDLAILRLLLDTGMRRAELASLLVDDLDFSLNIALVRHGKGDRPRPCPFGHKAARDLDRYLRLRARQPGADDPHVWIGLFGPMTGSGMYQIVRTRAKQAGYEHLHTHMWRHTFADQWLAAGGQEGDLMRLGGWSSRSMLDRYGASAANARAHKAHQQFSPGDRF